MPLLEKLRIEMFLPDSPDSVYPQVINLLENELTFTFGGCSVNQGLKGMYHSPKGEIIQDRIHLLFSDIKLRIAEDRDLINQYVDSLQESIHSALNEEKILIAVYQVFHQSS